MDKGWEEGDLIGLLGISVSKSGKPASFLTLGVPPSNILPSKPFTSVFPIVIHLYLQ